MRKEKMMGTILDEVIRDNEGKVIATREYISEIVFNGRRSECITREVIKLQNGRIVIDQVLHRSEIKGSNNYQSVDFLTGFIQGG